MATKGATHTMIGTRIQIAYDGVLLAEVIVDPALADQTVARYSLAKYHKGLPIGGAILQRADLPRTWDVPVGTLLAPDLARLTA